MGLVALAFAFVAGLLTALSPCVLPMLPLVMGSAARNRFGPTALAAGFVTTFTVIGVLLASLGTALGLSDTIVRSISAVLLVAAGVLMISHRLQDATGRWLSPLASASAKLSARADQGLGAQFFIGALLGGVWSPCSDRHSVQRWAWRHEARRSHTPPQSWRRSGWGQRHSCSLPGMRRAQ